MTRPTVFARTGIAVLVAASVSACAVPLTVQPAPHAADPDCARVMLAAPDTLGGLDARGTTAQAAEAWGVEFPIVVRCGIEIPTPSTDTCFTIDTGGYSADWVLQDSDDYWIAATYGRDPAVEVVVPKARADQALAEVLQDLTPSVALAPTTGRACLTRTDVA